MRARDDDRRAAVGIAHLQDEALQPFAAFVMVSLGHLADR